MQTEDHPFDYGEFEGVIPEGYGAGIVMLWDRGSWTPEVDDVDAALRKGDLKFTLSGYKLKGSWVLVRTSGRYPGARGGRPAIVASHQTSRRLVVGELDITEFAPRSVKSDGEFEDILAEDNPAIWVTNRPAKGGDAGAMLASIIERAAELKAARQSKPASSSRAAKARTSRATSSKPAAAAKTRRTGGSGSAKAVNKAAARGGDTASRKQKK